MADQLERNNRVKISPQELPALIITLLLGGFAAFGAVSLGNTGGAVLTALLLAFACASCTVAFRKMPVSAVIIPLGGGIALFIGSVTRLSWLLGGILLLCSALLCIGLKKELDRTRLLLLCGGGFSVLLCVGFVMWLGHYGGIGTESVDRLFAALQASFEKMMREQAVLAREAYTAAGLEVPSLLGDGAINEVVSSYIMLLRTLLPAEIICAGLLFGYVTTRIFFRLARMCVCLPDAFATPAGRQIEISLPGALIFAGTLFLLPILSLFANGGVFYTALLNIFVIWLPGLCVVGWRDTLHPLQLKMQAGAQRPLPRPNRVLRFLLLGGCLLFFPIGVPVLLSIYGVLRVVTEAALKRMESHEKREEDDFPEDH